MAFNYTPQTMQVTTRSQTLYDEHCNTNPPSSDPKIFISTGSGQTAAMVNGTNGAYYEFASGTTANAETIVLFKRAFAIGATVQIQCDRSVATGSTNQETYIEIVEVDPALLESSPATAVITSGTSVQVKNARNAYQILWPANTSTKQVWSRRDGNTAVQNNAAAEITGATVTASLGTSPNFLPAINYILKVGNDGVSAARADRATIGTLVTAPSQANSTGSIGFAEAQSAHTPIDTSRMYALRIRVKNGASAPAASIITRVYRVTITEDAPLAADVFSGGISPFGSATLGTTAQGVIKAMPVRVVHATSAGMNVNIAGSTASIPVATLPSINGSISIVNSQTALGIAGVFDTGVQVPGAATSGFYCFHVVADQASATNGVVIECSNSTATNWRVLAQGTLVADIPLVITARLAPVTTATNFFSRVRARVTNGGVAQTNFSAVFYGGAVT